MSLRAGRGVGDEGGRHPAGGLGPRPRWADISRLRTHRLETVSVLVLGILVVASCYKYAGLDAVGMDDSVYSSSVRELWRGGNPYADALPGNDAGTPFTYPPFALVVMAPLAALSFGAVHNVMTALTAVSVVLMCVATARALGRDLAWWQRLAVFVITAGALRTGDAVLWTLKLGQVSVLIAALCLVDIVLLRRTRASGLLIALAAAIKVTPALFIVLLLVLDRRAGIRAAGWAAGFTALGAVILPSATWRYFTDYLWNVDRVGDRSRNSNASVTGVLARLELDPAVSTTLWCGFALAILLVTFVAVRRVWAVDSGVWAATMTGQVTCLVAPMSWNHHASWYSLAAALLVARGAFGRPDPWPLRAAYVCTGSLIIYALFAWALLWAGPEAATTGLKGFLVQNVFFVVGAAGLAGMWVVAFRSLAPDRGGPLPFAPTLERGRD